MNLRKAAEMALEALELGDDISAEQMSDALEALRQALAQPEQEPMAWMCEGNDWGVWKPTVILGNDLETHKKSSAFRNWEPLYTAPPKREWVGLTDKELQDIAKNFSAFMTFDFARAIETRLKEKNE